MTSDSEFLDRREIDRRHGDDRGEDENTDFRQNRRDTQRRLGSDRRRWAHGVIVNTNESYRVMEDWLGENCQGEWSLALEEISESLDTTSYRLMFEIEGDKRSFIGEFTRRP